MVRYGARQYRFASRKRKVFRMSDIALKAAHGEAKFYETPVSDWDSDYYPAGQEVQRWLDDALDIERVVGVNGKLRSINVLTQAGGPTVTVTFTPEYEGMVEATSAGEKTITVPFQDINHLWDKLAGN